MTSFVRCAIPKMADPEETIGVPNPPEVWIGKGRRKWLVHPFRYLVPEMPADKYKLLVDYLKMTGTPSAAVWLDKQEASGLSRSWNSSETLPGAAL
jgi:hypothetical protein